MVALGCGERRPQQSSPGMSWAWRAGEWGRCHRSLLVYYCTGRFKTVSDTNAEREKLTHTSLCYKSCRPLNDIQFILHGYLQMHSSDLLSNHITDRVRKEAWKNTNQANHITCVSEGLRHKRDQKAASGKFYFLFF